MSLPSRITTCRNILIGIIWEPLVCFELETLEFCHICKINFLKFRFIGVQLPYIWGVYVSISSCHNCRHQSVNVRVLGSVCELYCSVYRNSLDLCVVHHGLVFGIKKMIKYKSWCTLVYHQSFLYSNLIYPCDEEILFCRKQSIADIQSNNKG